MKTIRNGFDKVCSLSNLVMAHKKSKLGKGNKSAVLMFELDTLYNLAELKHEIETKTYQVGKYHCFKVYEPKERDIMSLSYRDRIVQHTLCDNVLEPYLDARLDYDNAACRKGKGTYFALNRLKTHMQKAFNLYGCDYYILKCDIRKYFYNIDHQILKNNLYKYIDDDNIKWLLDVIIDSTDGGVGLPIGNMTSQWFAVFYLDMMDKYIRETLQIKLYTRYMDDFIMIHEDKAYLKTVLKKLKQFLWNELRLTLNEKTQIFPVKNGVDYIGFHSYLTPTGSVVRKLRERSKKAMKRKVSYFNKAYYDGDTDIESVSRCIASWSAHAKHGNTYKLRKKILGKICLVRNNKSNQKGENK